MAPEEGLFYRLSLDKERLMSLNDGVFAIAITLLVLDIRLPEISSGQIDTLFLSGLGEIIPALIGFTVSFFIIASYWLAYHRILYYIRTLDRTLVALNIFFLFFIAFMPFPTSVLGLYGDHVSVVIFYAASILVTSIILFLFWQHAISTPSLIDAGLDRRFVEYIQVRNLTPIAVFLLSIGVALVSPLAAMFTWGSLAVIYPLIRWIYLHP